MACRVALLGVGVVGGGVSQLLVDEAESLSKKTGGLDIKLVAAADLDQSRLADLEAKGVETTTDANSLLARDDIDVVVELVGGTGIAKEFVTKALRSGKSVVTANKALIAHAGKEIFQAAREGDATVGFSASVCGGVPVLLALRSGLVANDISSVMGIVNGTCNYILTKMSCEGTDFATALEEAKAKGYAEADPTLDVDGHDSAHKLEILTALAFKEVVDLDSIPCRGISDLERIDVRYAAEMGYVVKLLAIAKRLEAGVDVCVAPTLLPADHPLAAVSDVYNAVFVTGHAVGKMIFGGRGAGRMPTASNVVADIVEIARGAAPKTCDQLGFWADNEVVPPLAPGELETRFYVRFTVDDSYGVLGRLSRVLGEHNVSISSVIQKEQGINKTPGSDGASDSGVDVVMLTHEALERDFRNAVVEIDKFDFVKKPSAYFRVEED